MAIDRIRRMPYGLRGFRAFCRLLVLEDGSAFRLQPFQAHLLGFHFAGVTSLVITTPKKAGKTTLLAALALYHLLMTPSAKCFIGAASEEQASWLFDQAAGLVIRSGLERRRVDNGTKYATFEGWFDVKPGVRRIRFEHGFIRVLPHDVRTSDGVIPTLALVDELHRHPSGALYAAFRDGLVGAAQMITISTPGASYDSPLGRIVETARGYRMEEVGRRRTYTSPDGSFVLVEYGLLEGDDPDDLRMVKMANPAPWQTIKKLGRRRDDPSTTRAEWLRYACGLWGAHDEAQISAEDWDRLAADIGTVEEGDTVILVPSVGHNAAIGIASARDDGRVAVAAEVIEPQDGRSILEATEERLVTLMDRYDVAEVQHPVGVFLRSADLLAAQGLPMAEAPHSPARLTAASGTFDRLLASRLLIHDGDTQLRAHVLAGERKVSETGERFLIFDRARALIAIVLAVHAATVPEEPMYIVLPTGAMG